MTQITAQDDVRDTLEKLHVEVDDRLKVAKSETEEVRHCKSALSP